MALYCYLLFQHLSLIKFNSISMQVLYASTVSDMFFYVGSYFISFCVRVCFWLTVCFIVYLSTEEDYCYLVKSSLLSSCINWIHSQCLQLSSMKSIMHLWWYNLIIHVALCFLASSSKENNAFFFFFILPFLSLLLQLQFRMLVLKENRYSFEIHGHKAGLKGIYDENI